MRFDTAVTMAASYSCLKCILEKDGVNGARIRFMLNASKDNVME